MAIQCENRAIDWCRAQILARGEAWHWASCGSVTGNVCHWIYWLNQGLTDDNERAEGKAYLCKRLGDMWYNSTISAEEANQLWRLAGFPGDITKECGHAPGPSVPPGGPAPTGPFPPGADQPGYKPGSPTPGAPGTTSANLLGALTDVNPLYLLAGAAGLFFLLKKGRAVGRRRGD